MYNSNDSVLHQSKSDSVSDYDYRGDLELIFNGAKYHSDEVSETDEERTQEEINKNKRLKNKFDNHVIRVYDKSWQSKRVRMYMLNSIFHLLILSLHYIG